jgi:hypothetical protein
LIIPLDTLEKAVIVGVCNVQIAGCIQSRCSRAIKPSLGGEAVVSSV